MSRTGFLVVGALIFALAAAGVLVWTNTAFFSDTSVVAPSNPSPPPQATEQSQEKQLVNLMDDVAASGGYTALFTDSQIRRWSIADGHTFERHALDRSADVVIARLSSNVPTNKPFVGWPELGLSWILPVDFATIASGKNIEIGVVARSAPSNPSPALSVIFATRQAGNSDWHKLKLSSDFSVVKFRYQVPAVADGYKIGPVLVLHSDAEGTGRSVELLGAYAKVLP